MRTFSLISLFLICVLSFTVGCTGMIDLEGMDGSISPDSGSQDGFADGGADNVAADQATGDLTNGDDVGPGPCSGVNCGSHGTCVVSDGNPSCQCDVGYHPDGLFCIHDADPCSDVDCGIHGTCIISGDQPACNCDAGYHQEGLSCVQDASDPCEGITCSSHGTCVASGDQANCNCDSGYHAEGLSCVQDAAPCDNVTCSGHGVCQTDGSGKPQCICDDGYVANGLYCVSNTDPCDGQDCSSHGTCLVWDDEPICACDDGYTPPDRSGLSCVPTSEVCVGGAIDYDVDGDGTNETWFEPSDWECLQYELVNRTRATHDPEGSPECHTPLSWSVIWAAHGRNHATKMKESGGLFHDDYPWGQNCAYGCDPACEMNMYMTGSSEPHCPDLSHHCNIMRCSFSSIGIGYDGNWNTQNFL